MDKLKALSHPLRFRALHILNARVASPNGISLELGVDVNKIAYHVRVLDKFGCIELVDTKQRRGATEHFYRATSRSVISDDEWVHIPRNFKDNIVVEQTKLTGQAISDSLASGAFNARDDRRQSWIPMQVDDQGWTEAMAVLAEAEEKLLAVQATSAKRLAEGEEEAVPVAVSLMGFETAPPTR
jgi:predicted ArsR family transcriptional regulator